MSQLIYWILIFGSLLFVPSTQNDPSKATQNTTTETAPCPPVCHPDPLPPPTTK